MFLVRYRDVFAGYPALRDSYQLHCRIVGVVLLVGILGVFGVGILVRFVAGGLATFAGFSRGSYVGYYFAQSRGVAPAGS